MHISANSAEKSEKFSRNTENVNKKAVSPDGGFAFAAKAQKNMDIC